MGGAPEARRWHVRLATPPPPDEAVETIIALVGRALDESGAADQARSPDGRAIALGIAFGDAELDAAGGRVRRLRYAPGWVDVSLAERLAERLGGPVRLVSVTDAAALAEAGMGAGRDADPLLYVALGRTVTCSFVVRGRPVAGGHGAAGRLGHWLVRPDGPRCSCGARGHLEPLASAQSLVRNMIGRASDSDVSTAAMLRVTHGRAEAMTAAQVVQLAGEGDPAAGAVLGEAVDALALALVNLAVTLDPAAIIFGGTLAGAGEGFLAPLRARLDVLWAADGPPLAEMRVGRLEPLAGLLGAQMLALGDATDQ